MNSLVVKIGNTVFLSMLQLIAGYLIAACVYGFFKRKEGASITKRIHVITGILSSAIAGTVLPLGPIGAVPIAAISLKKGLKTYLMVPLFISGILFNTSIPFVEMNFLWKANTGRIILAITLGILSGLLVKVINLEQEKIFRLKILEKLTVNSLSFVDVMKSIGNGIYHAGPYIVLGAAVNILFHRYVFYDFMSLLYGNPQSFKIAQIFLSHNASVKPLFLLSITMINTLLDFLLVANLLMALKVKGIIACFTFYLIFILGMMLSVFIL